MPKTNKRSSKVATLVSSLLCVSISILCFQGPHLVIHQSKECLEKMGEWCQSHHAASGKNQQA